MEGERKGFKPRLHEKVPRDFHVLGESVRGFIDVFLNDPVTFLNPTLIESWNKNVGLWKIYVEDGLIVKFVTSPPPSNFNNLKTHIDENCVVNKLLKGSNQLTGYENTSILVFMDLSFIYSYSSIIDFCLLNRIAASRHI